MVFELWSRWRGEDDEVEEELRYGLEGGCTFIKVAFAYRDGFGLDCCDCDCIRLNKDYR